MDQAVVASGGGAGIGVATARRFARQRARVAIVGRRADGLARVAGLIGTRFTMEQDFYRERMASLHGIDVIVPGERERAVVHDVIYDELCHGVARDESRAAYRRIIDALQAAGAEAVILGCTEITLLIKPADSALPVFDTTALHALAAVEPAAG